LEQASGCEQRFAVLDGLAVTPDASPGDKFNAGSYLGDLPVAEILAGELHLVLSQRSSFGGWRWRILSGFAM
jgi:hypothetical protein